MIQRLAPRYLLIFVLGAIFGTAYDYIHVYFEVLTYHRPDFVGTSLAFVPVEFGLCAVIGTFAVQGLAGKFAPPKVTFARLGLDAALLLIAYLFTGVFVGRDLVTFIALAPLVVLSVALRPTPFVFIGSAFAAFIGPFGEVCVSRSGIFHYNHAELVPVWLPLLWVIAAGAFIDLPLLVLRGVGMVSPKSSFEGAEQVL